MREVMGGLRRQPNIFSSHIRSQSGQTRTHVSSATTLFQDQLVIVAGASNGWQRPRRDVADLIAEPWSLPPYDVYNGSLIEVAFRIRGYTPVHLPHALLATGRYLSILSTSTLRLNGKRLGLKPLLVEAALLRITRKIGRLVLYRFGFIEWA
jgi:hypothetical protein